MNKVTKLAVLSVLAAQLVFAGAVSAVPASGTLTVSGIIAGTESIAISNGTPAAFADLKTAVAAPGTTLTTITIGSNGAVGFDLKISSLKKFNMENSLSALAVKPTVPYTLKLVRNAAGTNAPAYIGSSTNGLLPGTNRSTELAFGGAGLDYTTAAAYVSVAGESFLNFRTTSGGTGAVAGPISGIVFDVKVSYAAAPANTPAGTYQDTVTFLVTNAN